MTTGQRSLDLRPFDRRDFAALLGWLDSPAALFEWSGHRFSHPLDAAQLERHVTEQEHADRVACTATAGAEPVGHIELWVAQEDRAGTLCRVLVAPDRRRRGIGRTMVTAMLDRAFGELGLHRVELRAFAESAPALRLYEALGFVHEGTFRECRRFEGRYRSVVLMSLLEDEWSRR